MQNWDQLEKVKSHVQPLVDEVVEANQHTDPIQIRGNILNATVNFRRFGCSAVEGAVCFDCLDSKMTVGKAVCEWLIDNPLESSRNTLSSAGS